MSRKCKHYFPERLYELTSRVCSKCGAIQQEHVKYGWVTMVWKKRNQPPYAFIVKGKLHELAKACNH